MNGDLHSLNTFPRWHGPQRRIGITGGVASGKSSVGNFLQEVKSFPVIDADVYSREALSPGKNATAEVIKRYGNAVKANHQSKEILINRSALRKIIFSNKRERLWLEQLIHPIVTEKINMKLIDNKNASTVILIIPLLFEAGFTGLCSETWVVHCTEEQQLRRLMRRERLTKKEAYAMINSQLNLEEKKILADITIDNTGLPNDWIKQIESIL